MPCERVQDLRTGITPRKEAMPIIDRVNERLAALADGKRVRYVNMFWT